jgi:hypothetical protein
MNARKHVSVRKVISVRKSPNDVSLSVASKEVSQWNAFADVFEMKTCS